MSFDLAAYLARIGLGEAPAASAAGLALVQRAHRLAIPFEGLDIALGRGISLDPDSVFDKLVTRRRGGYCFEQNGLFLRALHALGFHARPLLGRVWLGLSEPAGRTHALSLVSFADGTAWIGDVGFGGSYVPPLPLVDGATAETSDSARHVLRRDPVHGWMLWRSGSASAIDGSVADAASGDGLPQYSFTTDTVWPADLALANHWTATSPDSRFVRNRIVSIVLPTGFASLIDRAYRRASATDRVSAEIANPMVYRMRLSLVFGIALSVEEVAALGLFDG